MKKIEAIIRTSKFYDVKDALHQVGIDFFTFVDVKGVGNQKSERVSYRGVEYDLGSIARTKLEIVVSSESYLQSAIQAIMQVASTGEVGDGKIFVSEVEQAYRIRDGRKDVSAIDVPLLQHAN
ncbi:MAG TPA: P-II family nitrogen regulator [Cytophagaceae bacterium]|jgi:nitrogen regulatory protein PII|nr:P-II family nitrogen regulator [Cytophagaceae bacterium]